MHDHTVIHRAVSANRRDKHAQALLAQELLHQALECADGLATRDSLLQQSEEHARLSLAEDHLQPHVHVLLASVLAAQGASSERVLQQAEAALACARALPLAWTVQQGSQECQSSVESAAHAIRGHALVQCNKVCGAHATCAAR